MSLPNELLPVGLLGTGAVDTGYLIERSLRFNSADSAYLSRTPASAGNRKTWTWAGWVKNTSSTTTTYPATLLFARNGAGAGVGEYFWLAINNAFTANGHQLAAGDGNVNYLVSTAFYRDPSAWYHIVCAYDSTQATAASRLRLYVNGAEVTTFNTNNRASITQNSDGVINRSTIEHRMGLHVSAYSNCYLADVHFIDGQALTPTSFGELDANNIWQPKAYGGTYGTNGFHLDFADNSTAAALGYDAAGSNDWTVNNLSVTVGAGNDSLVDSPTNYGTDTAAGGEVRGNYCTFDPLAFSNAGTVNWTLANGNLDAGDPDSCYGVVPGTIGVSSGKYYWELTFAGGSIGSTDYWGIERCDNRSRTRFPGNYENAYWFRADGNKVSGTGAASSYGSSFALTDKAGIAFDADNGTLTFYKNGTSLGAAFTGIDASQPWRLVIGNAANATSITTWTLNAGQRPFIHAAPSGFKALCTQNLPTPTITNGATAMDVKLYTGTGASQTITGLGFSPDFIWTKARSVANSHFLYDVLRVNAGSTPANKPYYLRTDTTAAESVSAGITSFDSNGFTLDGNSSTSTLDATYAAWCWDAGSSTVTNTAGTISSQVRASASNGFSVVTYTGTGANATVGHGLGIAPQLILVKCRNVARNWNIYSAALGATQYLQFTTAAAVTLSTLWNNTAPTSSVFSLGTSVGVNGSTETHVAYCWAPVAGYSAFGSYTGNGNADGPFVFCGFRPAVVIVKMSSSTGNWTILDDKREGYNVDNDPLYPNLSDAEGTTDLIDITSNGFKVRTTDATFNTNAGTYVYAAWAQHPFALARAR